MNHGFRPAPWRRNHRKPRGRLFARRSVECVARSLATAGALLLLPLVWISCLKPEERLYHVELQVGGTAGYVDIVYESPDFLHREEDVQLPWTYGFDGLEGEELHIFASAPNLEVTLWLLVLEDGEEVLIASSCLCNGNYVSVEAHGTVGHWED